MKNIHGMNLGTRAVDGILINNQQDPAKGSLMPSVVRPDENGTSI